VRRYRWVILGAGTFAQSSFAAVSVGLPALAPVLRSHYHLSLGRVGIVLGAVSLGMLGTLLPWGLLADRIGQRAVMSWRSGGGGARAGGARARRAGACRRRPPLPRSAQLAPGGRFGALRDRADCADELSRALPAPAPWPVDALRRARARGDERARHRCSDRHRSLVGPSGSADRAAAGARHVDHARHGGRGAARGRPARRARAGA